MPQNHQIDNDGSPIQRINCRVDAQIGAKVISVGVLLRGCLQGEVDEQAGGISFGDDPQQHQHRMN